MTRIEFTAWGVAAPKGSAKGFAVPVKGAPGKFRAVVTHDNARTKGWQHIVADAAGRAVADAGGWSFAGAPVRVLAVFYLPRPKSHPKRRRIHHTTKPDLDKLARTVKDALKGIVYNDDAQVVGLKVEKFYAPPDTAPHAVVAVQVAPDLNSDAPAASGTTTP